MSFLAFVVCLAFLIPGPTTSRRVTAQEQQKQKQEQQLEQQKQEKSPAAAQPNEDAQKKGADHQFAIKAAQGNMAEIELGKLALKKSTNEEVKQFAQTIIGDHTSAQTELKSLASRQGINLPGGIDQMSKSTVTQLDKLTGAAFDRAFIEDMVKDHDQAVNDFETEASSGSDAALKDWASKTVPTLKEHQRMAKEIAAKLGATPEANR